MFVLDGGVAEQISYKMIDGKLWVLIISSRIKREKKRKLKNTDNPT